MLIEPNTTARIVIDMQRNFFNSRGYAAKAGLHVNLLRAVTDPIASWHG
jgi:nicotinamidase-related amidase